MCGVLFLFAILQSAFSAPSAAQIPDNCMKKQVWYFPDPVPAGWFYYGPYPGTYAYRIAALAGGKVFRMRQRNAPSAREARVMKWGKKRKPNPWEGSAAAGAGRSG